jgi:hypothetical protein
LVGDIDVIFNNIIKDRKTIGFFIVFCIKNLSNTEFIGTKLGTIPLLLGGN